MFFEIISETLLPILPMFALKVALSTAFQPAKTVWQNKFLFSRYRASQNLGMPGQKMIFFSKSPNDSIRKVNHLKSIFEHFLKILLTELLGLSHFSAKKWGKNEKCQIWFSQLHDVVWPWNLQETIKTMSYGVKQSQKVPFTHFQAKRGQLVFGGNELSLRG